MKLIQLNQFHNSDPLLRKGLYPFKKQVPPQVMKRNTITGGNHDYEKSYVLVVTQSSITNQQFIMKLIHLSNFYVKKRGELYKKATTPKEFGFRCFYSFQ
jgi:hypothetical protein